MMIGLPPCEAAKASPKSRTPPAKQQVVQTGKSKAVQTKKTDKSTTAAKKANAGDKKQKSTDGGRAKSGKEKPISAKSAVSRKKSTKSVASNSGKEKKVSASKHKLDASAVSKKLKAARQKRKPGTIARREPEVVAPSRYTNTDSAAGEMPFGDALDKYMGTPYRPGGKSLEGMDCSGFASRFFQEVFGINLPHNSQAISQLEILESLSSKEYYRPSDLLFFGRNSHQITHLGIYLANGKFVHAASSDGVTISSIEDRYWKNRLVASKRVKAVDDDHPAFDNENDRFGTVEDENMSHSEANVYLDLIPRKVRAGVGTFHQIYGHASNGTDPNGRMHGYAPQDSSGWLRGWRAHLNLNPAEWVRLTPSVSWIDGSRLNDSFDNEQPVYGIETIVGHRNAPWAVGVSAHSSAIRDSDPSAAGLLARNRQTDLSFGLHYQPARTVGMSLGGNIQPDAERTTGGGGASSATSDQNALYFRVSVDF